MIMKCLLLGLLFSVVRSFNENLKAVHYSIVDAGIDESYEGATLEYKCEKCTVNKLYDVAKIEVDYEQPRQFTVSTAVTLEKNQNVRLEVEISDFVSLVLGDNSLAQISLNISLVYDDQSSSETSLFDCSKSCVDGKYQGTLDVNNEKEGSVTIVIDGVMFKEDTFLIKSVSFGDLILKSEIYPNSTGIVTNSCSGVATGNVFFGKAGVGKSTVASLVSSKPGLFDVGTSGQGTTTLGTWLSSSIVDGDYAQFADAVFSPTDHLDITPLKSLDDFYNNQTNLVWLDTEGLDYQTEFGDNYDVVTILPHTLIAENVFLLVRDRVNPAEVIELIDKLAKAAERTQGTFTHRDGKLFGRFFIVVNKCQDISKSDEEELETLKTNNPSLITKVQKYFTHGPEIVLLPLLQWNYELMPDFNEDGFFLDYDHISTAHPPLRDRMFYGLHKLAGHVVTGVPTSSMYTLRCETFEPMLKQIYDATTEDVIDINQLDYEWLLLEAKGKLDEYVRQFTIDSIGFTSDVLSVVCPESDKELFNCFQKTAQSEVDKFYDSCLEYIDEIFPKGKNDLSFYLDEELMPVYVLLPLKTWFETCEMLQNETEMYSDEFLKVFENSKLFGNCSSALTGKLEWNKWEECSKTCYSNDVCGVKIRIAVDCVPEYAVCKGMQVQREDCNCEDCPEEPNSFNEMPIGSIIPWVPKPNKKSDINVDYNSYEGWIKCNGEQACKGGPFDGQVCTNMADMALIGAYANFEVTETYSASLPDHHHPHDHTTDPHTHGTIPKEHQHWFTDKHWSGDHHCGTGGKKCTANGMGSSHVQTEKTNADVGVKEFTVKVKTQETMSVGKIISSDNQTKVGDLYPKNIRVHYIFKCF